MSAPTEAHGAQVRRLDDYGNLQYHPEAGGRRYVVGCAICEAERAAGNTFFPGHVPSGRCQSGKKPHCSCSSCF